MSAIPRYEREFGAGFAMPALVIDLLNAGELIDVSWHHDTCPSFYHRDAEPGDNDEGGIRFSVQAESPADREADDVPRYGVWDDRTDEMHTATDDLDLAIRVLRQHAAIEQLRRHAATAITDQQIEQLRAAAVAANDWHRVSVCDCALGEFQPTTAQLVDLRPADARVECLRAMAAAAAAQHDRRNGDGR